MSLTCPNCGSTHIEQYDASGASICTECGVVVEENAIVSSVDFVEGAGGASSMVGQFVSATSSKAFTGAGGGRGGYGFSRDSRETTLANGKRRIQDVASRLRLGNRFIDAAHRLFTFAVEKNFVQGRRTMHVVAACLYIACRQEKSQHMLIDFSDALQVNVYTLGTCFLKFRRLLGLKLEILDPALYVYRFAAHLDLDDKANAVAMTALRLVGRMKRDWIVAGRRPAGICAAALLISARAHGFSRHPQDVTRILRVCGMTVNTRVREFEHTPSASLTLEQFNNVELVTEADPPVFTKNRIMEARARAIQENDVELLNSGKLDDPMSKSASKWRENKVKQKDAEMERMYESLEKEMHEEMELMSKQKLIGDDGGDMPVEKEKVETEDDEDKTKGDNNEGKAEIDDEKVIVNEGSEKDKAEATSGFPYAAIVTQEPEGGKDEEGSEAGNAEDGKKVDAEEFGAGDDDDDEMDKKPSAKKAAMANNDLPVSILKKDTPTKSASLEVCKKVTIIGDQLSEIPEEWAEAYPKSRYGRAIVLPDQSTPEERRPSVIPVEGRLETKVWKENMPEEMINDIESIFRNPTEIAQKEAIFNKINKDYIELQAQKERQRKSAAKAQTQDDIDMEEQEKGHERYRKRKNRGAGTTQEALLDAVSNRKISRKINYDAMSAIFGDDGQFATDTVPQAEEDPLF